MLLKVGKLNEHLQENLQIKLQKGDLYGETKKQNKEKGEKRTTEDKKIINLLLAYTFKARQGGYRMLQIHTPLKPFQRFDWNMFEQPHDY